MHDRKKAQEASSDEYKTKLLKEKHINYVKGLLKEELSLEQVVTEHLRMSGIYWACGAMSCLNALDQLDLDSICQFVLSCRQANGGFSGNVGHDAHILYTTSAVQIMIMAGRVSELDADSIAAYVKSLQLGDGSFMGDEWGEVDTRFSYCAILTLSLLRRREAIDMAKAVDFVVSCSNFDGGFGCVPGAESHAAQVFCCVQALHLAGSMDRVKVDRLGWFLAERQVNSGGMNGRPEKLADVCYSWWVVSSLASLDRTQWVDLNKLRQFVLLCQDGDEGGIADKPGNMADVFHTFFGLAGLALEEMDGLQPIDSAYALPVSILKAQGFRE